MILTDTSVWIDHLRRGNDRMSRLLESEEVLVHAFVTGELACASFRNRREILSLLHSMPQATVADHGEVLQFVETHRLIGKGLGYVDVHLLASVLLHHATLWTFDRRLGEAAARLRVSIAPE